uniref:Uncharacterized protein n=1 Tax=Arundo donax TaxID=35708 RepID=A0A0A8ZYT2_ARUDO
MGIGPVTSFWLRFWKLLKVCSWNSGDSCMLFSFAYGHWSYALSFT